MTRDLTAGRPARVLLAFSLPLLLSTVLQQFYNIADSVIIGRFSGEAALAAIGAAYPITLFYVAIATGASMGCSVVVSRIYGSGRMEEMRCAVSTAVISLCALGAAVSLAGIVCSGPLMELLNAQSDIFPDARGYLSIYAAGALPMLLYNASSGVFTGMGDSKLPLYLLLSSSVLNVGLDYIAVRLLGLGVAGAAWATTLSQVVAAGLTLVLLLRRMKRLCPDGGGRRFSAALMRGVAKESVPCILQQSCIAVTHTLIQGILNTYDTAVIAGYEAASKLHNFAYMGMNTIGTASASFTAQCCGARKFRRVREGFRASALICLGCTLVVVALFQAFPRQLIGIFLDETASELVYETGIAYLRIISPVYLEIFYIISTGGLLRGVGKSLWFFLETIAEISVRVVMCFVLTRALHSYTGVMWAWYFGSSVGFLLCLTLSIRVLRGLRARAAQATPAPSDPR